MGNIITGGTPSTAGTQTATSGIARDIIINGALRLVGAYATGAAPRADQVADAAEAMDMMLRSWQLDGMLWLRQFIYVTLAAGQASYGIGPTSTDVVTSDAAGSTPFIQRPPRIYDATRYTIATADEVPVRSISRSDYMALTNKTTTGSPVQVYYDPQITNGMLYVWPTASAVGDKIKLSTDRLIADVGASDNLIDIPPEWQECVKYNLALRLSGEYPPGIGSDGAKLAIFLKEKMDSHQRDTASTFFQYGRF